MNWKAWIWVGTVGLSAGCLCWGQDCWFDTSCSTNGYCRSRTNWVDLLDVDGDGSPDFRQISCYREWGCFYSDGSNEGQFDDMEALFLPPEVEPYLRVWAISDSWFTAALTRGQPIEPHPSSQPVNDWYWAWNPERGRWWLARNGVGWGVHNWDRYPCIPDPFACAGAEGIGLVQSRMPLPLVPLLFGIRWAKPDGWHLGWLKVEELASWIKRPDLYWTRVKLTDYAIHPDADTVILAGERPRPAVRAAWESGELTLSWSTNWPGWTLEHASGLGPLDWQRVPDVTTNRVTLSAVDGAGYFRLKQPE